MKNEAELPWEKKTERMYTPWYADVSADSTMVEYPRPQLVRNDWVCLNGLWDYAIRPKRVKAIHEYDGKILVPYPVESALSGVKKFLSPRQHLFYHRQFTISPNWAEKRIILHFGAVDWRTTVKVNGKEVGIHIGGYNPFSFDITSAINQEGKNDLEVKVFDPTDAMRIPAGKQKRSQIAVFYTPNSGIWQTVWLEAVPSTYIKTMKMTPDVDTSEIRFELSLDNGGHLQNLTIRVRVKDSGFLVAEKIGSISSPLAIHIPHPKLWSPETPFLYDVEIDLLKDDQIVDSIQSYFGMRKFSLGKDDEGKFRFFLNNKPYFMMGTLDQGYWPDGVYTAPTDEALAWDIEITKRFGFNMIRKHIKIEPPRWYYHCDRLGVIVWQDMPSPAFKLRNFIFIRGRRRFKITTPVDDTVKYWRFGLGNPKIRQYHENELKELIDTHYNATSIGMWVPFNESWGQYDAKRIADWLSHYDSSRLVDHTSGWYDQGAGNFKSIHNYGDTFVVPEDLGNRGIILSETGGYTRRLLESCWDPNRKFAYKQFDSEDGLHAAFSNMIENVLLPGISKGLSGAVYTQTTDVEIEYNGLATYDRKILKLNPDVIKPMVLKLYKQNG